MHVFWLHIWPHRHALFEVLLATLSIAGVWIGAWTTRSWQREQWILDHKKQEFRDLLSVIGALRRSAVQFVLEGESQMAREGMTTAFHRFAEVASDRIFIAPSLARTEYAKDSNVLIDRFLNLKSADDALALGEGCTSLHRRLRELATSELSRPTRRSRRKRPAEKPKAQPPSLSPAPDQPTS